MVAGDEGIDVLAFGSGSDSALDLSPAAKAMWAAPALVPTDGPSPFALEAEAGPLERDAPAPSARRRSSHMADVRAERAGPAGLGVSAAQ